VKNPIGRRQRLLTLVGALFLFIGLAAPGYAAEETLFNNWNIAAVQNGPTSPTIFTTTTTHQITYLSTYHWNNGKGVPGGTVGLSSSAGKTYGPWQVTTTPGQGGVPNANWIATPNVVIPPGTYTVIDSDPSTWSQNSGSGGQGFAEIRGLADYAKNGGVAFVAGPDMNEARMAHATAVLPNGKVALFGGHGTGFVPSGTADIWDPAANVFTLYNMKYTHDSGAFAKLADGRYLLAGGASSSSGVGYTTTAEIFDPEGPTFTATGSMTQARTGCAAATLTSGKVLVAGGWYNTAAATSGDLFDPATNTFTATGSLSTARAYNLVLPTSDGGAVVCGGMGPYGSPYIQQVELYNPTTKTFSILQESLLPQEPGWMIFGMADWSNGRSIDTQRLTDGRYLLMAWNQSTFALVTFDPATKIFAKYNPNPPLPSSGLAMAYHPVVALGRGEAYNLTRVGSWTAPFPIRNYTLNLASGSLVSPALTTPLNYCMYCMGMNLLADGRLFLTGGGAAVSNFNPLTKTFFATPMQKRGFTPSFLLLND
jgi:hypothetical protein